MRRIIFSGLLLGLFISVSILTFPSPASANSVSISPLQYKAKLAAGESKKGFVDVINSSSEDATMQLHVKAFRQIDNDGSLEFYTDSQIERGVKLDLKEVTLGPREGVRVYFILDGNVLPSGDVFAAIFATTAPEAKTVSIPAAQAGTLLMLENSTPVKHTAVIDTLTAPWLQISDAITMEMSITNTDPEGGKAIGFTPKITFLFKPHGQQTVDGPLLFAGRTRLVDFRQAGDYFGPVLIEAEINGQSQTKLIFAVTGYWRWLAPFIFSAIILAAILVWLTYKDRRKKTDTTPVVKNRHL